MNTKIILIVDDELPVRRLAQIMLEDEGYQVHIAGDACEALRIASRLACRLNLLVSDMIMPGCDGHELIREIRQICPFIDTMMMSGAFVAEDARLKDYKILPKPFTKPQLVAAARTILDSQVF
jgi:two-component system, cell cycle sensor histidine kinase and response regulator CckA